MFGELLNAAADLVTAPIEVAKDVVTLGGLANGQDQSYTEKRLKQLIEDGEDILDS